MDLITITEWFMLTNIFFCKYKRKMYNFSYKHFNTNVTYIYIFLYNHLAKYRNITKKCISILMWFSLVIILIDVV